jgi:hypothetical protein
VQKTGLNILLIGMAFAIPIGMILCEEAAALSMIIGGTAIGLAVTRWIRQFAIERKRKRDSEPPPGN